MDYQKIYNNIIERARQRDLSSGYFENHHIIPKSIGGTDDAGNLVKLTLREHYIAHKLLHYIYPDNKQISYAFWMMSNRCINNENVNITAREYEEGKQAYINSATGVKRTDAQRQCISEKTKVAMRTPETLKKCKANIGSKWYYNKETLEEFKWFPNNPEIDLNVYAWGRPPLSEQQKATYGEIKDLPHKKYYIPKLDMTYIAYSKYIKNVPDDWVENGGSGHNSLKLNKMIDDAIRTVNLKTDYRYADQLSFKYEGRSANFSIITPAIYDVCRKALIRNTNVNRIANSILKNIKLIECINYKYLNKPITDNILLNIFFGERQIIKSIYGYIINNQIIDILDYINNRFKDSTESNYQEILYRIKFGIEEIPKCPICGKQCTYTGGDKNGNIYTTYCSVKCAQSDEKVRKKRYDTSVKKYGYGCNLEKMQETNLIRYGCKNTFQDEYHKEKIKETNLKRFGVDNPGKLQSTIKASHTAEANNKRNISKHKNNTFNKSQDEDNTYIDLTKQFGEDDIIRQYKSDVYPFRCDFYIKSRDLYIECNYHWTHGGHLYDPDNIDDNSLVDFWKSKQTAYYNNAIKTWTERDIAKENAIRQNQINCIKFYSRTDFENWLINLQNE